MRKEEIMAGKHGRKKPTQKKSENSIRARENVAPIVEEHVEEQSDGNNSDDLSPDLCQPSEEIKGRKRKNPSSISSGVSTRTRARKAVSDGNEPVGEDVVHEESTRVREKTAVSLSLDSKSEDMSAVSSKVINSVLVPTLGEETLLACIIDEEPEYNPEGSASDTWNYWLVVKEKKIWWKELYEQDTVEFKWSGREDLAFMDKGFSGLLSSVETKLEVMDWRMSELERNQRLLRKRAKKIEVRLTSIESKENEAEENNYGEDMDFGQWDNMDCGKPEGLDKMAAEEDYDRAKGKDKDTGEEENEESTTDKKEEAEQETEQEAEEEQKAEEEQGKEVQEKQQPREDGEKKAEEEQEKRVQDSEKEGEKEPKETPTPLRGRTKAAAARKLVHSSPEKFFQFARPSEEEELARLKERCAVQAEKLWREIEEEEEILESPDKEEVEKPQENTEKSDENPVESPAEEEVEKTQENAEELVAEPEKTVEKVEKTTEEEATHVIYTEEEKQSWYMVVYKGSEEESPTKEAATPAKNKAKAEKKKVDGAPKKRGRPKKTAATLMPYTPLPEKRKGEPSWWVQSPFTEGKTDELEVPKKKLKTKA
ncbi:hypothetical protein HID58_061907 [Brassica napus]|uniref:DUF287 domain-containing protein n=1 Tax=Brassica napus TaxID=3708 RepID=A0ABQ7ZZW3_BRANA|nr:hypothetical protein HID58_061907 [Brassica napus]